MHQKWKDLKLKKMNKNSFIWPIVQNWKTCLTKLTTVDIIRRTDWQLTYTELVSANSELGSLTNENGLMKNGLLLVAMAANVFTPFPWLTEIVVRFITWYYVISLHYPTSSSFCLLWIFSQKHLVDRDAHRMALFHRPKRSLSPGRTHRMALFPRHLTPTLAAKAVS